MRSPTGKTIANLVAALEAAAAREEIYVKALKEIGKYNTLSASINAWVANEALLAAQEVGK